MKNPISKKVPDLLSRAALVKSGAETYGAGIPLIQNTSANISDDRDALVLANNNVEQAKVLLQQKRDTLEAIELTCYAFCVFGRDILKPILGSNYSEAWNQLGLYRSIEIPRRSEGLLYIVEAYGSFFIAHPDREDAAHNITAVRAQALYAQLLAARADVAAKLTELDTARGARNVAATRMFNRIRGVFNEMKQFVAPLDPRWTAFGFNKPGAENIPDVPQGVTVVLMNPTAAIVRWSNSARAEHYRLWKRVIGVDPDLVAVSSTGETELLLEGLPANSTIKVGLSAVNSGGETKVSELVTITTP